jgi:hypothetical protein
MEAAADMGVLLDLYWHTPHIFDLAVADRFVSLLRRCPPATTTRLQFCTDGFCLVD